MAGLQWIRIDTAMFQHPKFLYLEEEGNQASIVLHLKAMCYSAQHDLAGFLPDVALSCLGGCLGDAKPLIDGCLWTPAKGGWQIHGWAEFQPAGMDAQQRRERAQKGAAARWAKRNGKETHANECS
jgi:hypothetical protein